MEVKISTPELRKHINKPIKYKRKNSGIWVHSTIIEIHNRQINVSGDWIPFGNIASIVLI